MDFISYLKIIILVISPIALISYAISYLFDLIPNKKMVYTVAISVILVIPFAMVQWIIFLVNKRII